MKYKKGDIISGSYAQKKVIEVIGELYFLSADSVFDRTGYCYTEIELDRVGYTLKSRPKEDWIPKMHCEYWYIDGDKIEKSHWEEDEIDLGRKEQLGIFKTEQEAQERLDKIKEFIKTL